MFSVYPSETSVAAVIVKRVFRILDEDNAEQEPPALMVNPDIGQLIGSIVSKKSEHDSIVSGEAKL